MNYVFASFERYGVVRKREVLLTFNLGRCLSTGKDSLVIRSNVDNKEDSATPQTPTKVLDMFAC